MGEPQVHFTDVGRGPVVLLVHGHPFDRRMWRPQLEALPDAGFRVVAPDLRGYGESAATQETVTMRDLAADLVELLDRQKIASAAVIGLSMGGLVAMEFAHAHAARTWAVGLVATTADPVTTEEVEERRKAAATVEAEGMAPLARSMSARLYGPRCPREVIKGVDAMMLANNPSGAAAALRGRALRPDYRGWLAEIEVPTWVCAGTADAWSTHYVTQRLLSCLPNPQSLILEDVGHLPNLEAPGQFNQALTTFLVEADKTRQLRAGR